MSISFKNVNEKVNEICMADPAFIDIDRKALALICDDIYALECSIDDASSTVARREKIKGWVSLKYQIILGHGE